MNVDDILNESDDSSTPDDEEESSQENSPEESRAPFELDAEPMTDFPGADLSDVDGPPVRRDSDAASQADEKAGHRFEELGLRRGLKTLASTFVAKNPTTSLISSSPEKPSAVLLKQPDP